MRKVELVVKGILSYITNEGESIRTYLQRWELNINVSVRKYCNRSDYLIGGLSNSNKIITKETLNSIVQSYIYLGYCGSASLGCGSVLYQFCFFFNVETMVETRDRDIAITSSQ